LVNHGEGNYSNGKGDHINGLDGFGGSLKLYSLPREGITRARLILFIAKYISGYNEQVEPERVKVQKIFHLLEKSHGEEWDLTLWA
jgi:hypothetical protein